MKFDAQGNALRYPGNTIICSVHEDNPAWPHITTLQQRLMQDESAGAFTFLPPGSFHMTLFRGVNDQRRFDTEWPKGIPLDTPLEKVTEEFKRRLATVQLPDSFTMRPDALRCCPGGEQQLFLVPADEQQKKALEQARNDLHSALRHSRPGDDSYEFHITFCYKIRNIADPNRLQQIQKNIFEAFCAACGPTIQIGKPCLCTYEDMLAFYPVMTLGRKGI